MSREVHTIAPVYSKESRILILGSFPSVKSRADGFFYAHPRNRFWRVVSHICAEALPSTISQKRDMLLAHGIALWDVCAECEISASSDASIKSVRANDIDGLLKKTAIQQIFTNGTTASTLYRRLVEPSLGICDVRLPSTSPANAAKTIDALVAEWEIIKSYIL